MSILIITWPVTPTERAKYLADILPHDRLSLLRNVADEAKRRNLSLYLVGGFVRDLLLGRPLNDFDLVVEGRAIPLARALAAKYGGRVTAHIRFGTAQWFLPDPDINALDFISTRSETYKHPAALPTVKPGKLIDDLHRRDFTINTLALRLDGDHFGEIRDDLGGLEDLKAGIIRVLHPYSFSDDPTRLIRAVRYEQRYRFRIAPDTLALIPEALPMIANLSAERVRHELDLVLEEEKAAPMLKRMAELGILKAAHPGLQWSHTAQTRFEYGMSAAQTLEHPPSRRTLGWTLWLMDLTHSTLERIDKRLHFEAGLRNTLMAAARLLMKVNSLVGKKPSQCTVLLDEFPLKSIQAVFLALPAGPARVVLHDYIETWRHIKPKTTGHTLLKRGIPQGPVYQSILRRLRAARMDGEVKTDDEEMDLLGKLASSK